METSENEMLKQVRKKNMQQWTAEDRLFYSLVFEILDFDEAAQDDDFIENAWQRFQIILKKTRPPK